MKPILYTTRLGQSHDTGAGHPECPARLGVIEEVLAEEAFCKWPRKQSEAAELETIMLAHDEDYIFKLQEIVPDAGLVSIDGDTILSPDSYQAALEAVGAVCQAVEDVKAGESNRAFCAVRPPGHHAEPNTAMGFCLFNNIFIGARYAQERRHFKKIAIVDFDVHHGNGTDTMTRRHQEGDILYISTHGYPLFPMTGDPAENNETVLNIHLPDGCGSKQCRDIYENQVFPALESFAPDLLMVSAGFDAHKDDPLAPANWETADYGWLTKGLCTAAEGVPVISVLEGGYNLEALKSSVRVHLQELGAE